MILRRATAVVLAQAAFGAFGLTMAWVVLASMGGIEPGPGEIEATWRAHALGTTMLVATIVSAPAFAVAAVVLWNNAALPIRGRGVSAIALLWATVVWSVLFVLSIAAMVLADDPAALFVLVPIGGFAAVLGLTCARTCLVLRDKLAQVPR